MPGQNSLFSSNHCLLVGDSLNCDGLKCDMACSVVVLCWTNLLIHVYQVVVSYSLKQVYNALKQQIIRMQGKIKRLNLFLWWNWCNLFNGLCSEIMRGLCFVNVLFLKVILILVSLFFLVTMSNSCLSGVVTEKIVLFSFVALVFVMLRAAYLLCKYFFPTFSFL